MRRFPFGLVVALVLGAVAVSAAPALAEEPIIDDPKVALAVGSFATFAAPVGVAGSSAPVAVAEEPIDDPKVGRRLGARLDWPAAETPRAPARAPARQGGTEPPRPGTPAAASAAPAPPPSELAEAPTSVGAAAVVERVAPAPARAERFSPPRLELAFRRFNFVQIGATGSTPGIAVPEPFNTIAIDVYPLSSLIRLGLSTQYGWQAGTWTSSGDYFAAESVSAGVQLRGDRVVPFAEGFAGIGYMRRLQFDRTVPTAYWQLGVDVGANVFVARSGFVTVALGYLRAVNGFLAAQQFTSAFLDTWSFKLGVGL